MRGGTVEDSGFTLVELMVVVLIIGILVTIVIPVFSHATALAEAKSCQANQRTIIGAVEVANSTAGIAMSAPEGQFAPGLSGWYDTLVPGWVRTKPDCPTDHANYFITTSGAVTGDNGASQTFKDGHEVWQ